ncbi:MAG: DUF2085 domain-containing protein [Balneolaceae bacterium]|nr:MAG: DUF2085 domain-containing protein [Balneolaceae bacterium]
MQHRWFYTSILASLIFLVIVSLGGGIWGAEQTIGHWTGRLLEGVCHQMPDRSFSINGVQMAVNTRCFGIFAGLLAGWLSIPVMIRLKASKKWTLRFLLCTVFLQIADFTGNLLGLWVNTNISRFMLGLLLGIAVAAVISELFKQKQ